MELLGEPAIGGLDRRGIGIGIELERVKRAHFVAAAAAVAGAGPLIMRALAECRGAGFLLGRAARRFLGGQARRNNSSPCYIRRHGPRRTSSAPGCWAPWARAGRRHRCSPRGRTAALARPRGLSRHTGASGEIPNRRNGLAWPSLRVLGKRRRLRHPHSHEKIARGPVSRVLSSASRRLGDHSSRTDCPPPQATNPGDEPEQAHMPPLFGLAPGGVCHAAAVAGRAVRSCRTLSPLPARSRAVCFLWHFP